jgi:methionyl aminopeptidase
MVQSHRIVDHSLIEICDLVENMIRKMGGEPAFPCNVSINEIAAHCTAGLNFDQIVKEGDIVTVDLGVHVNGYIADTATTISLNPEYDVLVEASRETLNAAIKVAKKDVPTGEIGRVIAETASNWGFIPISNLTGHSTSQYVIHAGASIPNVWIPRTERLKSGVTYAIEPFLTLEEGSGSVEEGNERLIFSIISRKRTGRKDLDNLINMIWNSRRSLPFTPRWYLDYFKKKDLENILEELIERRILKGYPILVERSGKYVSQFEHTIMPSETGVIIIT